MTPNEAGRKAMDALPDRVKIGGFDFAIVMWTHHQATGASRYGEFASVEQTIRFQRDMPSKFKAVDTVMHEIGHAIYWVFGIFDDDKEERVVSTFSTGWLTVHRDNPWLARWISETLSDD